MVGEGHDNSDKVPVTGPSLDAERSVFVRCRNCGRIYDNRVSSHCPQSECAWLAPATPEAPRSSAPGIAICPAGHAYLKTDHAGCPQCRNFSARLPISFAIAFAVLALPITLVAALLFSGFGQ